VQIFWVELSCTSFGKIVLHGKNPNDDAGEDAYYEVSNEVNADGDFAIHFFKSYERMKEWLNNWQGECFYDYLVELYEKELQRNDS
jgi:hypothetical protein